MRQNEISIEGARLLFKNFSGAPDKYNKEGDRNFCVVIEDPALLDRLQTEGYNVRILAPREEGDAPTNYIRVKVNYNGRPPKAMMITRRNRVNLNEATIGELDYADLQHVDLVLSPYHWDINGDTGVTPYLSEIYAVINESVFAAKYAGEEYPEE